MSKSLKFRKLQRNRLLFAACLALSALTVLAGCSRPEQPETTLVFFSPQFDPEVTQLYNKAKETFEKSHPRTSLLFVTAKAASLTDITNELEALKDSGRPPDLIFLSSPLLSWLEKKYGFENLQPLAKVNGLALDKYFDSSLLENFRVDDKLFALPAGANPIVVMYNKAVFKNAGIPEPSRDWTWEQFAEIARKLKDTMPNGTIGTLFPLTNHHLSSLVLSNGGSMLSPDGLTMHGFLTGENSVAAIEWYAKSVRDKLFESKYVNKAPLEMEKGRVGMYVSTFNELSLLSDEQKEHIGVVEQPSFSKGSNAVHGSMTGIGIWRGSKHPELALDFLKLVALENNEITSELAAVPFTISKQVNQSTDNDRYSSVLMESIPHIKRDIYGNPFFMNVQLEVRQKLERAVLYGDDIRAELFDVAKSAEAELSKFK